MPLDDRRGFLRWLAALPSTGLAAAYVPHPIRLRRGLPRRSGPPDLAVPVGATRLGLPRFRHPGFINALQFTPDGKTLVTGSDEIRGWDVATGRVVFRFGYPPGERVDSGRLTDRGSLVMLVPEAGRGRSNFLHYSCTDGSEVHPPAPVSKTGSANAYSRDGGRMVMELTDRVALFDTRTGKETWHRKVDNNTVKESRFFEDGATVAVAVRDEILLLAAADGKLLKTLVTGLPPQEVKEDESARQVDNLAVSADGKHVAAAIGLPRSGEETILDVFCWEVATGKLLRKHEKQSRIVGFTARELVTFRDGTATFWRLDTGAARSTAVPNDDDLALSPDGTLLACPAYDSVILIDVATLKDHRLTPDPPGQPADLVFVGRDRLRGLLDAWRGWIEWDLARGVSRLVREVDAPGCSPVAVSRAGNETLYQSRDRIVVYATDAGRRLVDLPRDKFSGSPPTLTPDGRWLVSVADGEVSLTSTRAEPARTIAAAESRNVLSFQLSFDGTVAAWGSSVGDQEGVVDIVDVARGVHRRRIAVGGEIAGLRLSADGGWMIVGANVARQEVRFGEQPVTKVYDTSKGRAVWSSTGEEVRPHLLGITASGRVVAILRDPRTIEIIDVLGGGVRRTLRSSGDVGSLAFSQDGRRLAAVVDGAPVFLWDLFAGPASGPQSLDSAWRRLRSESEAAHAAMRELVAAGGSAVDFMKRSLPPSMPPDPKVTDRLIRELDGPFRRREQAMKELAALGDPARGPLKQALEGNLSPEARERVEKLLSIDRKPDADSMRMLRAVEATEVIGTPEASDLLKHWAGGAGGMVLTEEARVAFARLTARN